MDRLAAISLQPSRIAGYLNTIVFLLAIASLWLCGLSLSLQLVFTIVLLCAGVWQHQKQKWLSVDAICFEQEQWWALIRNHKTRVELVNEQLVLPWLVVLNFRINEAGEKNPGKIYILALWPDMATADDLRRLRVWLRYG